MSRIARIAAIPFECWIEVWRWIGAQGGSGTVDEILRGVVRGIWLAVTLALFPMLVISLLIGA